MPEKDAILINDDLFHQTITCPLKSYHILENDGRRNSSGLIFRQRNKLHIRDAIALQFENCRHTSNSVDHALDETEQWMNQDTIAICGAVIQHEKLLSRIPILVKNGRNLTIIQVHGRLRKGGDTNKIDPDIQKRSTLRYLLKAAYRFEILKRRFPSSEIEIQFYFPHKLFKASYDGLHLFDQDKMDMKQESKEEFSRLYAKVSASEAVQNIHQEIPGIIVHRSFAGVSVSKSVEKILTQLQRSSTEIEIDKHSSCKYCEFRMSNFSDKKGCWQQFFPSTNIKHPEKHIFELIGHGNAIHSESGVFFQEEVRLSQAAKSFEEIQNQDGSAITILQRRNLQILKAKDQPVPSIWIKPGITSLNDLKYPLHFLDFEAATYSIPMRKGSVPYSPVYFQFSCHSLYQDGSLIHSEWLDQQPGAIHPHKEFVNQLGEIPDIFQGTIMQYSPFEKQGVNRLLKEFNKDPTNNTPQIQILKKLRGSELPGYENRFFDVSKMIRDYYYNHFLEDGLGVKQVLSNVLKWEESSDSLGLPPININDKVTHITGAVDQDDVSNPYSDLQQSGISIADGSAAMNAWLCYKNGLLDNEEKIEIPKKLRFYCTLDSYALVVIYKHLERFLEKIDQKDFIEF